MDNPEKDRTLAAVIVDDDILSSAALARLLTLHCPGVRYVAGFTDPVAAVAFVNAGSGDVFFVATSFSASATAFIASALAARRDALVFYSADDERSDIQALYPLAEFLSTPIEIHKLHAVLAGVSTAKDTRR